MARLKAKLKKANKLKGVYGGKGMVALGATAAGTGLVARHHIKKFQRDVEKAGGLEGGSDVGNFLRRNSYNFRKNSTGQGSGGLTDYLKQAQAKQDQKDKENQENYGGPPPTTTTPTRS